MPTLTNNFSGGSNGTIISTANSGGTGNTAFDGADGTAAMEFSNAQSIHSTLAGKFTYVSGTAATPQVNWTTSMTGSPLQTWFEEYLYIPSNPPVNTTLYEAFGTGINAKLVLTTTGKIQYISSSGSAILTTTASVPLNKWFRIEAMCQISSTVGQVELKLFTTNADGTVADETDTSAATQNTGTVTSTTYAFGDWPGTTETSNWTYYMGFVGVSSTGYIGPQTLWNFVGTKNTDTAVSATTQTISLPTGVQGGDLVVVSMAFTDGTSPETVAVPGFTTIQNSPGGAKPGNSNTFGDNFWSGYRRAAGAVGSATSDTTFTATFNATAWSESVTTVLRPSTGAFALAGSAEYHGNAGWSTTCPDASYTPTSAANATVWGYAGQISGVSGTATLSGTGVSALSNFVQQTASGNGGVVGQGWLMSTAKPGGATSSVAIDATDFAAEFAAVPQLNLTVTATASGNTSPGFDLTVLVLTGAKTAASQTGASGSSSSTATSGFDQSLTIQATGSEVVGSIMNGASATAYTADARTTLLDNFVETVHGCTYGTFRSTSLTASTGSTAFGATNSGAQGCWAAAEILAAATIAVDASAPVTVETNAASTATTASFAPPPGSLIVVLANSNCTTGSGTIAIAVTDTGGLTFTQLAFAGTGGGSGVWIADVPTGIISSTPYTGTDGTLSTQAIPGFAQPGNFIPGQVSTGNAAKFSSDTGSGAEGPAQIQVSGADTGSGAEGPVKVGVTQADTGSGAEGPVKLQASSADTGTGGEAQGLTAQVPAADTGSGTEAQGISLASADTGSGADTQGSIALSSADAGTGSEAQQVTAAVSSADTGTGSEAQQVTARVSDTDAGSGTEAQGVTAHVSDTDAGSGTDTGQASSPFKNDSDTGHGTEAQSVLAQVSSVDTGTGADQGGSLGLADVDAGTGLEAQSLLARVPSSDTGSGAESQGIGLSAADTATGADAGQVTAAVSSADTGTGSEAQGIALTSADTATGADAGQVTAAVSSADTGTGSEAQGIALAAADTGQGSEAQALTAHVSDYDTGTGTDSGFTGGGTFSVASADTGRGQEGDQEGYADTDAATGADTGSVPYVLVASADTGTGSDTYALFIATQAVSSADGGTGSESWSTNITAFGTDAGQGSDTYALLYAPADTDAGSGTEEFTYEVEVFPYPPPWLSNGPQGGYRLVWRAGTPDERVLVSMERVTRADWEWMGELLERVRYSDSISDVASADSATGVEVNGPTATVTLFPAATVVTCRAEPAAQLVMFAEASPVIAVSDSDAGHGAEMALV